MFLSTNYSLADLIHYAIGLFESVYGPYQKQKVIVEVTPDIYLRFSELCPNRSHSNNRNNVIGKMVFPDPGVGAYYILLHHSLLKDNLEFVQTLTHELCHLYDYLSFSSRYCLNPLNIDKHDLFSPLYMFSEFKSKALGYLCEYKFFSSEYADNEEIDFYINLDSALLEAKKEIIRSNFGALYHGTRFLSKLYIQDILYHEDITSPLSLFIPDRYKEMANLYLFLRRHFNTNINAISFDSLRVLFNEAFDIYVTI